MSKSVLCSLALSLTVAIFNSADASARTGSRSPNVSPQLAALLPLPPECPDSIGYNGASSMSPAPAVKAAARTASFRSLTPPSSHAVVSVASRSASVMSLLRQHPAPVATSSSSPARSPGVTPFSPQIACVHASGTPVPVSRHDIPTSKSMSSLGGC